MASYASKQFVNAEFDVTAVVIAVLMSSGVALAANVTCSVAPFKVMSAAVVDVPKSALVHTDETTSESCVLAPAAGAVKATVTFACPATTAMSWWCKCPTPNAAIMSETVVAVAAFSFVARWFRTAVCPIVCGSAVYPANASVSACAHVYVNLTLLTVTSNLVPTAGSDLPRSLWNSPCHTVELAPVKSVAVAGVVASVPGFEASM